MATFVYIHSGDRSSGTPADFSVTLPQPLVTDGRCKLRVDNFRAPNTYMTIDARNQHIYYSRYAVGDAVATIPVGFYNATQLGTILATYLDGANMYSVYDATQNSLQLSFQPFGKQVYMYIYTDADLAAGKYSGGYPAGASSTDPKSCNDILHNDGTGTMSFYFNNHCSYRVNFLSVSPYDYVFLRSKRLACQNSVSSRGAHDVLAMIPINAAFGEILTGGTPVTLALDIDAGTLNSLDFQLTDRFNRVVNQTSDISFQLTFFQ